MPVDVVIKEELFQLNQGHFTGANGTASVWSDNWRYQVPVDRKYIFRPGHTFSASFNNGTGSPAADGAANPAKPAGDYVDDTDRVRIEIRDPSENERYHILQDTRYGLVRHFQDRDLIRRLDISEEKVAYPGYWIVIMTNPATALAATDADTYLQLYCDLVRQTIM